MNFVFFVPFRVYFHLHIIKSSRSGIVYFLGGIVMIVNDGRLIDVSVNDIDSNGKCIIPYGIKEIEAGVFCNSNVKSVVLPSSITCIGAAAFQECNQLTYIHIPNSVTKINHGAFYGCENLKSVILPQGITELCENVFRKCFQLNNVEIPYGVKIIGQAAFSDCVSLTNITIPDSVTKIKSYAFCATGIKEIEFPALLTEIGERAFWKSSIEKCSMPNSVKKIGKEAFAECNYLENIHLPKDLQLITGSAFANCPLLKEVSVYENTKIGVTSFWNCPHVKFKWILSKSGQEDLFYATINSKMNDTAHTETSVMHECER